MFFLFCSSPAWNKSVAVPDLSKNRANPGPVSPFQVRESVAGYFFWSSRGKGEMCMEPIVWWSRLVLKSKTTVAMWVDGLKRDCPLKPVTCSVSCALGVRTTADMPISTCKLFYTSFSALHFWKVELCTCIYSIGPYLIKNKKNKCFLTYIINFVLHVMSTYVTGTHVLKH